MRISDWSSDVCSSDLLQQRGDAVEDRGSAPDLVNALMGQERHHHAAGGDDDLGARIDGAAGRPHELIDDVALGGVGAEGVAQRSEEHTSELQSLMRISYAVFCLNKKKT